MQVTIEDGKLFYKLFSALLDYVNRKLAVVPEQFSESSEYTSLPPQTRGKVRDALYEHRELIGQFIAENPAGLSSDEQEIVASWKHALMKGRPITGEEFERMLEAIPAALVAVSQRQRKKDPKRPVKLKSKVVTPALEQAWGYYLTGLWLSGLRLEESLILSWDEDAPFSIDLTGRRPAFRILAKAQKSGRDEVLPMTPDFAEFIRRTPEAERIGPVFRPVFGEGSKPKAAQHAGLVVATIGRVAKVVTNKAEKEFATAHDLRRSFGTRWAKRVMPAVLPRLMRHSAIQTTMAYYVELDVAEVADELWAKFGGVQGNTLAQGNSLGNIGPGNDNGHGEAVSAKSYFEKR